MYAGAGAATGVPASAGAAAAAAAAGSGGGDLKRKRSDPRLNCIKSVQYRVSRFPQELHDMCVEHWERTRCARVVCNGVQGVMSVQGGRCVVSFSQHGQEVLKGVADYLRYAGEDRIKKWRRHVRMVGESQGWLLCQQRDRQLNLARVTASLPASCRLQAPGAWAGFAGSLSAVCSSADRGRDVDEHVLPGAR
jgi:hypothetical protein